MNSARQQNLEYRASIRMIPSSDIATERLHEAARDGQAESGASGRSTRRPIEFPENPRFLARRQSRAMVAHGQPELLLGMPDGEFDRRIIRRVDGGVVQDVR